MISTFRFVFFVLLIACMGATTAWAAPAAGDTSPAPPPPPPQPGTAPALTTEPGPGNSLAAFRVVDVLHGYHFRPGEQVKITVELQSIAPTTVTTGADGTFQITLRYHWQFCGPNSATQDAPVYVAQGEDGSTARYEVASYTCPILWSQSNRQPVAGTPPSLRSTLGSFDVRGFGFLPGESVTLSEMSAGPYAAGPSVSTHADLLGRVHVSLKAHVPPTCTRWYPLPRIEAVGDGGTSVLAPLGWFDVRAGACPTSPLAGPPVPGPGPAVTPIGPTSSLRLLPAVARAGDVEHAILHTLLSGPVVIDLAYPGVKQHVSATAASSGETSIGWRIPRRAHAGRVNVTLNVGTGGEAIQGRFRIK